MPNYLNLFMQRARRCPLACSLKILFLLLFISALYIAVFYQASVSLYEYSGFIVAIAYIAILALVIHRNCRIKMSEGNSILK
jgi:uncharacterized membrane protein YjjB (DUF3815 family)